MFQAITEVFELRHLIGCAPQATVFQAALCLVIDNALQLIRGYAAQAAPAPAPVASLSAEQIFTDLHEELVSLHRTLKPEEVLGALRPPRGAAELGERLRGLLARAWTSGWYKAVNKKPRPRQPKVRQSGAHTSVHKVLQQAKQAQGKPTPPRSP